MRSFKSIQYGNISAYNTWASYWFYRNTPPPRIHSFIFTLLFSPTHFRPTFSTHLFSPKKWVNRNIYTISKIKMHFHPLMGRVFCPILKNSDIARVCGSRRFEQHPVWDYPTTRGKNEMRASTVTCLICVEIISFVVLHDIKWACIHDEVRK